MTWENVPESGPKIFVFNDKEEHSVADVLASFNSKYLIKKKSLTENIATGEDISQLECIVLCFHEDQISDSTDKTVSNFEDFLKNNKIDRPIPVIPIVYGATSQKQYFLANRLKTLSENFQSVNFLEKGLIWFDTESSDTFKNIMMAAKYGPRDHSALTSFDDDLVSKKGEGIAQLIRSVVLFFVGLVLGPIIGGLIGAFAFGGGAVIGAVIGLFAGPVLGLLIAQIPLNSAPKTVEEKRTAAGQQARELVERKALWEAFTASFFPQNVQEVANAGFNAAPQQFFAAAIPQEQEQPKKPPELSSDDIDEDLSSQPSLVK